MNLSEHRASPDQPDFDLAAQEIAPAPVASRKPAAKRTAAPAKPVDPQVIAYRHADRRVNNPEVGMVTPDSDPEGGKTRWAYDPHLDPALQFDSGRAGIESLIDAALASGDQATMQAALEELKRLQSPYLNWSGKAERTSFEVDTVSLHVHERIDPATILRAVQRRMKGGGVKDCPSQGDFFRAWFEEPLPLYKAVEFYKHDRGWMNRLVAGDSLLVMNSLLRKEGMAGQVQMIYIDPPYGIKYGSNFQPFTNKRDVKDRADADLTQEPEMIKAFRDTWELGIHSYLTYLRDRLLLAKELLSETGSVFVQISDENLHHVREIMDEVFGAANFAGLINYKKTTSASTTGLATVCDYIVWCVKNTEKVKYRQLYLEKLAGEQGGSQYTWAEFADGQRRNVGLRKVIELGDGIRIFRQDNLASQRPAQGDDVREFVFQDRSFSPGKGTFKTEALGLSRLSRSRRLIALGSTLSYVRFLNDFPVFPINNFWDDTVTSGFSDQKVYVVQTNPTALERCLLMTTDPGDLVLDPTCGSGTTAFVAEKWGRRWITCDTSRVAVTLAKQRLMTASFDYYELRYPHEGIKGGFFYKTVPHVTLKSIANNPEIDEIHARMHPEIEAALTSLNDTLVGAGLPAIHGGKSRASPLLREWEVPFDFPASGEIAWPETARAPFDAFHAARQAMQRQMDASIAAHADQETLYDQPQKAKNKLRITGPFTVEAVPFPSVKALDALNPSLSPGPSPGGRGGFEADVSIARSGESARQHQWRDELLKTGIRGKGGQMLRFADLETLPDTTYLHAVGNLDSGERVVVSFGPEHAALEQRQVEMALREAEKIRPTPRYIVFTAFTFDPEAAKDIDEMKWPGVTLLKAQMNTDLLTEDLKKARSNNQSFWLMGQPDVAVVGGQWLVDSFGEALLPYERFEELSGVGGLDEIDGLGYCGVPSDKKVSEGGNLRSGGADAAGGCVYPIEHRRRAIAELHRRISELSGNRARFSGGTGNPGDAVGKAGLSSGGSGNTAHATNSGSWSPAQWSDALARLKLLTADHLPLTTAHLFQVEVNGFDYFDTAKGELVSGGKNKIAVWSLDTDYDERSLFPRQVFFPMAGKGEGWEKLKKDIRAELDESLLGQFQGTLSLPFAAGENRKIAVKIVDDRGIESLKIVNLD